MSLQGWEYCTIKLRDDEKPVIHAPRRVPRALRERFKLELERMDVLGVTTKTEGPTDCVQSGKIRKLQVCMEPKDISSSIMRERYQIHNREAILCEMVGTTFFLKNGCSAGFCSSDSMRRAVNYAHLTLLLGGTLISVFLSGLCRP